MDQQEEISEDYISAIAEHVGIFLNLEIYFLVLFLKEV